MIGVRLLILLALLLWLLPAGAQAARVMIVRPPAASQAVTETVSRVHGELLSVGLDVELAARPAVRETGGATSRTWLERVAIEHGIDAAIDVVGDPTPAAVDIWVFVREPRRSEITRVAAEADSESPAERLAIRSVDVLRSILIEHRLMGELSRAAPVAVVPPPPPTLAREAQSQPPPASGRLGLELGTALVASLDGVGPAILPVVRVDWAAGSRLALQLELAGFGSRPTVSTPAARVRIAQQHALLGVCTCAPSARRWRPTFALLAGALHISADGEAAPPGQGHSLQRWSLLLQVSVGARLALYDRYELALAAHAQLAEPYVDIYLVDRVAATLGRPNLLLTATVGGWL